MKPSTAPASGGPSGPSTPAPRFPPRCLQPASLEPLQEPPASLPARKPVLCSGLAARRLLRPRHTPPWPGCEAGEQRAVRCVFLPGTSRKPLSLPGDTWHAPSRAGPLPRLSLRLGALPFCLTKPHFPEAPLRPGSSLSPRRLRTGRSRRCPLQDAAPRQAPGHPLCRALSICAPPPPL